MVRPVEGPLLFFYALAEENRPYCRQVAYTYYIHALTCFLPCHMVNLCQFV